MVRDPERDGGVLALRWFPPVTTPQMLMEALKGNRACRLEWKPMEEFPAASVLDALKCEGPLFWTHDGFLRDGARRDTERSRGG